MGVKRYINGEVIDIARSVGHVDGALSTASIDPVQNRVITNALNNKVDKESGKTLTSNDFTNKLKTKLEGIATGAEVNVQADWSKTDSSDDAFIKNKPTLGTAAAKNVPASGNASATEVVLGNDSRLTDARNSADVTDTYSATGTVPVSGKAVASAIAAAIEGLPEPMVFKGSLGTGGTITDLPTAAAANEGYTYKVITAGTYASQAAKVGDTFVSDGTAWVLIPSGDEPSGTVTSIKIKATSPIAIDSDAAITTSGERTITHADSGVTAGTYKSVTVDGKGHVTAGSNPTTLAGYGITDALSSSTKYAGSSTKSGAATSAEKLTNTEKIGDTNQPVYFKADGTPAAISYTIGKSVPSDAVFTDTTYESKSASSGGTAVSLVTTGEKYTWNNKSDFDGAYSSLSGKPTLGTAAAKNTTDTYSSTGTDPITGKGVAAAISGLDVTGASSIGAGKTISAWSETDGKVSISTQDIAIANTQVSGLGTASTKNSTDAYSSTGTDLVTGKAVAAALGTLDVNSVGGTNKYISAISETDGKISATASNIDTTVTSGSSNLITSGAVYTAIDNLPEPMIFKGSLGTGGTITTLPTAAASNEGYTYKVITAGTYASQAAKIGDLFISNGSSWVWVPSGDEPSGTVTSVKITATSPIVVDSDAAITTSGTRALSHANSGATAGSYGDSSAQTPNYGGTFKVPYVTVNATGHVTSISEHTVKIPASDNTNTHRPIQVNGTQILGDNTTALNLKAGTNVSLSNSSGTVTITSTDTNTTYSLTQDSTDGHKITLTPSSGTAQTVTIPDNNTTYSFAQGTNNGEIKITPSSGSATTVTPKGLSDLAYIAKGSGSSKYLREDGTWQTVSTSDTKVTQTAITVDANYEILFSGTADNTTRTEGAGKVDTLRFNPSKGAIMEGYSTVATGANSHAEGLRTSATGNGAHAEGHSATTNKYIIASGKGAHAEGFVTSNGNNIVASGNGAHAEGCGTSAYGDNSHAEGVKTSANGIGSHAEGGGVDEITGEYIDGSIAVGNGSHAEGSQTTAYGNYSHAEGNSTSASGMNSHAEGGATKAIGTQSHAEGCLTTADGDGAHAEGFGTYAKSSSSHAEGDHTTAYGIASHAGGYYTYAGANYSTAVGKFNTKDTDYAFVVGGGTSDSARKNLFGVKWDGTVEANGSPIGGGTPVAPINPSAAEISAFDNGAIYIVTT